MNKGDPAITNLELSKDFDSYSNESTNDTEEAGSRWGAIPRATQAEGSLLNARFFPRSERYNMTEIGH